MEKFNSAPHHFPSAHVPQSLGERVESDFHMRHRCPLLSGACSRPVHGVWLAYFVFCCDLVWQLTESWEHWSCRPWSARRNSWRYTETGGIRTWWHPPCHPLSASLLLLSLRPPVSLMAIHTYSESLCSVVIPFHHTFAWKTSALGHGWSSGFSSIHFHFIYIAVVVCCYEQRWEMLT